MSAKVEHFIQDSGFQFLDAPKIDTVVIDTDGTQIREDIKVPTYDENDLAACFNLKNALEKEMRERGLVVIQATNRMPHSVKNVQHLIAEGNYLTCAASTQVYKRNEAGELERDKGFDALVAQSGYNKEEHRAQAAQFPEMVHHGPTSESDRKLSYHFVEGTSVERQLEIFRELQAMEKEDGGRVFAVDDNGNYIIDFLPKPCNKGFIVNYIAEQEGHLAENTLCIGNSNNDIAMFLPEFNAAAVGDARSSLMEHVQQIQSQLTNTRHIVAEGNSTHGVINALRQFGVIPKL